MSELILGLSNILLGLINIYVWVIIIAALISWVNPDPRNQLVIILHRLSDPAYALVRRYVPTVFNGIDLAPLLIVIVLQILMLFVQVGTQKLVY